MSRKTPIRVTDRKRGATARRVTLQRKQERALKYGKGC